MSWSSSEILKIRLETTGTYIGFVDVQPNSTTLADVRRKITTDVEGGPRRYNFLLGDDVPISRRQEATQYASQLLPTATIRPAGGGPNKTTNKVVFQFQQERYSSWLPPGYLFSQLRQDACRYWKLKPSDVILEDVDGCAWPDRAEVESIVSLPLPGNEAFVVHVSLKDDDATLLLPEGATASPSGNNNLDGEDEDEDEDGMPPGTTMQHHPHPTTPAGPSAAVNVGSGASGPADLSGSDVENELWNIFSYYCVHGDTKEVQHLRRHHWLQMMRDIGLLGPTIGNSTPSALFRVIYQAETRGQAGSSGKMNYNEFLDALMNVAARACHPNPHRSAASPTMLEETDPRALDASFVDLLATYILPHAKRWDHREWSRLTGLVRSRDVLYVLRPFVKSLYDIFRFYAPDPHDHADGTVTVLHLYLDYSGFMKVVHDFGLKFTLGLSLQHLGEMFLAACASQDGTFIRALGGHPAAKNSFSNTASTSASASSFSGSRRYNGSIRNNTTMVHHGSSYLGPSPGRSPGSPPGSPERVYA
jgi:hypothetical protein